MNIIYLVRHAESIDNAKDILGYWRDVPLTSKGIRQTKKLAKFISNNKLKFDVVIVSPLIRTLETYELVNAELIKSDLGLKKAIIVEDVIERRGGEADGITRTEMVKRNPKNVFKTKFNKKTVIKAKGMESFPQCRVRAARVIKWINRNFKDKKILIVSHGDFGQMFYSAFYKIPWKQALDDFQFKNTNMLIMKKGRSPKTVILF